MNNKKKQSRLPRGWTLDKVEEIARYYDAQSEAEEAEEIGAAFNDPECCMISVPRRLLPRVRKLIAQEAKSTKWRASKRAKSADRPAR